MPGIAVKFQASTFTHKAVAKKFCETPDLIGALISIATTADGTAVSYSGADLINTSNNVALTSAFKKLFTTTINGDVFTAINADPNKDNYLKNTTGPSLIATDTLDTASEADISLILRSDNRANSRSDAQDAVAKMVIANVMSYASNPTNAGEYAVVPASALATLQTALAAADSAPNPNQAKLTAVQGYLAALKTAANTAGPNQANAQTQYKAMTGVAHTTAPDTIDAIFTAVHGAVTAAPGAPRAASFTDQLTALTTNTKNMAVTHTVISKMITPLPAPAPPGGPGAPPAAAQGFAANVGQPTPEAYYTFIKDYAAAGNEPTLAEVITAKKAALTQYLGKFDNTKQTEFTNITGISVLSPLANWSDFQAGIIANLEAGITDPAQLAGLGGGLDKVMSDAKKAYSISTPAASGSGTPAIRSPNEVATDFLDQLSEGNPTALQVKARVALLSKILYPTSPPAALAAADFTNAGVDDISGNSGALNKIRAAVFVDSDNPKITAWLRLYAKKIYAEANSEGLYNTITSTTTTPTEANIANEIAKLRTGWTTGTAPTPTPIDTLMAGKIFADLTEHKKIIDARKSNIKSTFQHNVIPVMLRESTLTLATLNVLATTADPTARSVDVMDKLFAIAPNLRTDPLLAGGSANRVMLSDAIKNMSDTDYKPLALAAVKKWLAVGNNARDLNTALTSAVSSLPPGPPAPTKAQEQAAMETALFDKVGNGLSITNDELKRAIKSCLTEVQREAELRSDNSTKFNTLDTATTPTSLRTDITIRTVFDEGKNFLKTPINASTTLNAPGVLEHRRKLAILDELKDTGDREYKVQLVEEFHKIQRQDFDEGTDDEKNYKDALEKLADSMKEDYLASPVLNQREEAKVRLDDAVKNYIAAASPQEVLEFLAETDREKILAIIHLKFTGPNPLPAGFTPVTGCQITADMMSLDFTCAELHKVAKETVNALPPSGSDHDPRTDVAAAFDTFKAALFNDGKTKKMERASYSIFTQQVRIKELDKLEKMLGEYQKSAAKGIAWGSDLSLLSRTLNGGDLAGTARKAGDTELENSLRELLEKCRAVAVAADAAAAAAAGRAANPETAAAAAQNKLMKSLIVLVQSRKNELELTKDFMKAFEPPLPSAPHVNPDEVKKYLKGGEYARNPSTLVVQDLTARGKEQDAHRMRGAFSSAAVSLPRLENMPLGHKIAVSETLGKNHRISATFCKTQDASGKPCLEMQTKLSGATQDAKFNSLLANVAYMIQHTKPEAIIEMTECPGWVTQSQRVQVINMIQAAGRQPKVPMIADRVAFRVPGGP